jgi:hypothetical protein
MRDDPSLTIKELADTYANTPYGRQLIEQGRREGYREGYIAVLLHRFGDHPQALTLTEHLLQLPDWPGSMHAIYRAQTVDELLQVYSVATSVEPSAAGEEAPG